MTSVAVVGAGGFVGSELVRAFSGHAGIALTAVTRANYAEAQAGSYDVLINTAMPAARFAARTKPLVDFRETVQKTADLVHGWKFRRFVQISSVSARCQLDTVYGRHKLAAEDICRGPETLIVRLGSMYDSSLTKGVLIDMEQGRTVFAAGESRYCFTPLSFVGTWVAGNWERSGVVEVGGRDAVALRDIAAFLGKQIEFVGALDHQEIVSPESDFPDAAGVFQFLKQRMKKAEP